MKPLYHPDRDDIQLSSVLYALSDPVRLHLVAELRKAGERTCGGMDVPVVRSTLSHHSRTLREAGVVRVRVQGTQRFLSIRTDDLEYRFPGLLDSILQAYAKSGEAAAFQDKTVT
ncbi:ArsR/SmtB family transcription factor [Paenibacillus flagellatus]|uniref:Transcriptional regulator n=1 Tax=Paenibacillus flagellatus TaxID=2211139 RepID=A0A2V5K846_9BACL|nr:helix-turn-helix transcriptional regulator [Paenibacillus flagellatus]PYI55665.1 transcriptional regulator [Paenibacillus flagellatus]